MANGYYYSINDIKQASKDLATASGNDAATVFQTIQDNPDSFGSDLEGITRNRFARTGLYLKGCVLDMY